MLVDGGLAGSLGPICPSPVNRLIHARVIFLWDDSELLYARPFAKWFRWRVWRLFIAENVL
jgi:hypothetical protein